MAQTITDILVATLEQIGVRHIFGLIGDSLTPAAATGSSTEPRQISAASAQFRIRSPTGWDTATRFANARKGPIRFDEKNSLSATPLSSFAPASLVPGGRRYSSRFL
jgi:hypothetical protein